jgi:hypothetical protein
MVKLIMTSGEKVKDVFLNEVKHSSGSILTVLSSKSFGAYKSILDKVCSAKKGCLVIDTVTEELVDNVVYVPASNLTALSIAINQAQQSFDGKATVIFDSISGLTVTNNPGILIKFLLFIIQKSRDWGAELILILPEDALEKKYVELLKQSCDEVKKK